MTNIEIYVLFAMLLWNRLFWFNLFPCSGVTPKVQTVQGERVLLKLGIWTDELIEIYKILRQNWDQQEDQLEKLSQQAMVGTADGQTNGQLAPT